ncbi:MAG TPA: glycogen/starch synthase [Bacillota bacterium]|nr:glycogen/starch synthase [Bacillota bacterium]
MLHILYIASECAPYAKSGGLGDVLGALPKYVAREGIRTSVIVPLYRQIDETSRKKMTFLRAKVIPLSWRKQYAGLYRLYVNDVTYYFVDNRYYFDRDALYGAYDDGERFAFFAKAVLDLLPMLDSFPDVLHCNDWQTAMVPVYLKVTHQRLADYRSLRTVFTIHNIEYQGKFNHGMLHDVLGLSEMHRNLMDLDGNLNYMKGAVVCCDALTTVSPTYAQEIRHPFFGLGLDPVIREHASKLQGILNGIDIEGYDPGTDPYLTANYGPETAALKQSNKKKLSEDLGLEFSDSRPLIGMVTRLVHHKGPDLVMSVLDDMMKLDLNVVMLGTGDENYEFRFRQAASRHPGRFAYVAAFSDSLASRIYASADFFLMPSISEPCGLSQMIALRYGTIPIVRRTGGLRDTVHPFSPDTGQGNGITFETINAHDMLDAIQRALSYYNDLSLRKQMTVNAFASDHGWDRSAKEYIALYRQISGRISATQEGSE